jgi:3D (Asp-Asp-Asp) domain-containing protein
VAAVANTATRKTATITAYSCGGMKTEAEKKMNCPSWNGKHGKTADGSIPVPYKTIACDQKNLGKSFEIEGVGQVRCTDTGGKINGEGRFDLYVNDISEARQWGVKKLSYSVLNQ